MIAKADIRRVQEWMGHADVTTTMKYLHYVERPDEAALVAEAFAVEPLIIRSLVTQGQLGRWLERNGLAVSGRYTPTDDVLAHLDSIG